MPIPRVSKNVPREMLEHFKPKFAPRICKDLREYREIWPLRGAAYHHDKRVFFETMPS